jgi:hypothetical protein
MAVIKSIGALLLPSAPAFPSARHRALLALSASFSTLNWVATGDAFSVLVGVKVRRKSFFSQ